MDVDADSLSGDFCPQSDGKRMLRSGTALATAKVKDLMEVPEPKQGALSAVPHTDQSGRPSGRTPAKKQRMTMAQRFPPFIGLASRQRNNQRGPDKTNAERLRERLQVSQGENVALKKEIEGLRAEIGSIQQKSQEVDQWNRHTQNEYGKLVDKYNNLAVGLEGEKEDHRKDNAQLQARINDLTRTSDRLRQMIVPISEKQVLDSDVVSRFMSLRVSILGLVRQTWMTELKKDVDVKQLSVRQRNLFASPLPVSYERLRCVVFRVIHDIILNSGRFFLREDLEPLEQQIRKVEKGLARHSSEEDREQVIEWRNTTYKATESLRQTGNRFSSPATNKIWSLLAPLQTKSVASEQSGRAKLEAICHNAVQLSLMLRQLKDDFWVDNLEDTVGAHISQFEDLAEDMESVAADTSHPTGTIVYVITGALLKRPKEDFNRVLVVEKAEVAVVE